jgi:phosphotransferase system HPr (HPr) family protein
MPEQATVRIVNRQGLHARPISRFVQIVAKHQATVTVTGPDGTIADGGSIFSMMTLAAGQGSELALEAEGPQARVVLDELVKLVAEGFGEA